MNDKPLYYVLDKNRNILPTNDMHEWEIFYSEMSLRIVNKTEIGDVSISTVFLGLDHGYGEGPPILFETMIFGGVHDQYQERYCTWEEAERGHEEAIKLVNNLIEK